MKNSLPDLLRSVLTIVFLTGFFAACEGGDGTGLPPAGPLGPNFSEIQANVFTLNCATTGCHFGAGAPQGLRLDAASSFALLVGVASTEESSVLRVTPGDPDNSYLVQKLEGTASSGQQMPLNAPALPQSTIDVIRQWISEDHQVRWSLLWEYTPMQFLQGRLGARFYDGIPQVDVQNRDEFFIELHGFF